MSDPRRPLRRLTQSTVRAHQRDTSQIRRLIDLTSEVLRSIAGGSFLRHSGGTVLSSLGTRWLAQRLTIVDLLVRAVYLGLTFGRGAQTLGEEYTDILPCAPAHRRLPSRKVRPAISYPGLGCTAE